MAKNESTAINKLIELASLKTMPGEEDDHLFSSPRSSSSSRSAPAPTARPASLMRTANGIGPIAAPPVPSRPSAQMQSPRGPDVPPLSRGRAPNGTQTDLPPAAAAAPPRASSPPLRLTTIPPPSSSATAATAATAAARMKTTQPLPAPTVRPSTPLPPPRSRPSGSLFTTQQGVADRWIPAPEQRAPEPTAQTAPEYLDRTNQIERTDEVVTSAPPRATTPIPVSLSNSQRMPVAVAMRTSDRVLANEWFDGVVRRLTAASWIAISSPRG